MENATQSRAVTDEASYPYQLGLLQAHAARLVEAIDEAGIQLDPGGRFALGQVRELVAGCFR